MNSQDLPSRRPRSVPLAALQRVVGPSDFSQYLRIVESINEVGGVLERTVSTMVRLPAPSPTGVVTLPLIYVRRGRRFHSLDVTCSEYPAIVLLPRSDTLDIARQALVFAWQSLKKAQPSLVTLPDGDILESLLALPAVAPDESRAIASEVIGTVSKHLYDSAGGVTLSEDSAFNRTLHFYSKRYMLWAQISNIPPDALQGSIATIKYRYHQRHIPRPEAHTSLTQHLRDWLALSPYRMRIPVPLLERSASYHTVMTAPGGMYVSEQAYAYPTSDRSDGRTGFKEHAKKMGREYGGAGECGTPLAHLYCYTPLRQDGEESAGKEGRPDLPAPEFQVVFCDRPPGAFRAPLWILASLVVLLGALGANWDQLMTGTNDRHGLVAFLLATPGIAAALAGLDGSGSDLRRAPLSARGALVAAIVISLAASAMVLLSGLDSDEFVGANIVGLMSGRLSVLALCAVAFVLSIYIAVKRIWAQRRYLSALRMAE